MSICLACRTVVMKEEHYLVLIPLTHSLTQSKLCGSFSHGKQCCQSFKDPKKRMSGAVQSYLVSSRLEYSRIE